MDKRAATLAWFGQQMRAKLDVNRHKGDNWEELGIDWLFERLKWDTVEEASEISELENAILRQDWPNVIRECADIANYAMMIADVARGLAIAEGEGTDGRTVGTPGAGGPGGDVGAVGVGR